MFKAKKTLGQNFLLNPGVIDKIVSAVEINRNDVIIEIGPGTGTLTEKFTQKSSRVFAIEKDHRLIAGLKEKFSARSGPSSGWNNVEIIEGDILKFQPQDYGLQDSEYKIVGNIPYYITSHLLKTVFENWPMPELIVLMVQKEVAQRIMAKPPHMNLLALSVQFFAKPEIISYVSRGSFRPMPKVDSAIIRLTPKNNLQLTTNDQQQFFKLVKTAFAGKRKQLKNTIGSELLKKTSLKVGSRPEELSLESWLKIASAV